MSKGMRSKTSSPLGVASASGFDEIEWVDEFGSWHTARPSASLWNEPFERNVPTRQGVQFQNRRNRHVLHFWEPTQSYVWCESAFEARCLSLLEFQGNVMEVSSQPFRILFAGTTPLRSHDPDFFGLQRDGTKVVVDVKPHTFHTEKVQRQFAETQRLCDVVGWEYLVMDTVPDALAANLANLRPNRLARAHPTNDVFDLALLTFEDGATVAEGRLKLNRRFPALAMPYIKHLLWHGHLAADLSVPIGMDTVLTTTGDGRTCCL